MYMLLLRGPLLQRQTTIKKNSDIIKQNYSHFVFKQEMLWIFDFSNNSLESSSPVCFKMLNEEINSLLS